jgi:branched-chain amino acid transport system substrate-binding protein
MLFSLRQLASMLVTASLLGTPAFATDPKATIKLGQTMPYSGPASAYSIVGRVQLSYFKMINEAGGVNGHPIELISLDDAYSPPKTVERVRQLVEGDEVAAIFSLLGTPPNIAVSKYLNERKVPQLLSSTSSPALDDPKLLPWTTILSLPSRTEGRVFAKYLLAHKPDAKVAILYQGDEFGKQYVRAFRDALGDKAQSMIVGEASYQLMDATIDSQIVTLKATGADTLINATTPKFSAQVIRRLHELQWQPTHLIISNASQIETVIKPAGIDGAIGAITTQYIKMPDDPDWANDPPMVEYKAFMKKWLPGEHPNDATALVGYLMAVVMRDILIRCGDDFSRSNLLRKATDFNKVALQLLVPGVTYTTTPDDHTPFKEVGMYKFDGTKWVSLGDVVSIAESK